MFIHSTSIKPGTVLHREDLTEEKVEKGGVPCLQEADNIRMDPYVSISCSKKHDLLKAPTMHLVIARASVILSNPHNCLRVYISSFCHIKKPP